jgi:uncharacterized membrane protein
MAEEHAMTWGESPSSNDRLLSTVAWLFPGPIVAVIIYLMYQEKSKFIKYHATQSLILLGITWILGVVILPVLTTITCGLGGVLYAPLACAYAINIYGAYLSWTGQWTGLPGIANYGR